MNLDENFAKYKDITLTIMQTVKTENYENLDGFFRKRQLILDNISNLNYSKEELKDCCLKYRIYELEQTLEKEIKCEKEELLRKIKENQKRKMAMTGYNNNLQAKAVFLSREF